jgi:hypothetical protein
VSDIEIGANDFHSGSISLLQSTTLNSIMHFDLLSQEANILYGDRQLPDRVDFPDPRSRDKGHWSVGIKFCWLINDFCRVKAWDWATMNVYDNH